MANLKDKYSDAELNKSNKAFDDLIEHPDMQALDDQGNAIARDLKNAEGDTKSPQDPSRKGVRNAENSGGETPENRFGYQKSETKSQGRTGWSRRKKILTGAGVGGGVAGLLALMFTLLPLKVPGILSMVGSETLQRVEQITEKRAKTILGRAILTKFGTHTGIVITGEGAFKTLVASMRTNGLEKRLAEKGLRITATPDGVRLTQDGELLGNGTLKNEAAIVRALESNRVTNKVIKDVIKEDIPSWRWMKRAKFAKWLRIKYGVPRYGLANSDKSDPEEKKKEMDAERAKRAAERTTGNFRSLLGCILSGGCEAIDGTNEASNKEGEGENAADDIDAAADESVSEVEKNGLGDRTETTKTITTLILDKFGSKAIPIVGWIDLIATLDHFAHEAGDNDYVGKIAAYYKGAAYASIYAEWSGYSSQVQLGAMDPEYIGVLANELNDAEKAQAFQAVMGDSSKGVPIETLVNSDKPSSAKELYDTILNGPLGFSNKYIGHPILNAYYETIGGGGFLGWVAGGLGDLLGSILSPITGIIGDLTPDSVKELALETVSELGPWLLKTFGLTIDEFETGPELMNNIFGGGVVSANDYCKDIGCRKLSSEQAYEQNRTIAVERAETIKEKGVLYGLFSTEEPKSLTNQLAYAVPTSVESGASSVSSSILSIPSRIASLIAPQSRAATGSYESLYGVAVYGATENDLNQPLAQQLTTGDTCPDVAEGEYNNCAIDLEVAEAMLCEYKPDEGECAENTPDSGVCYGTSALPEWTGFPTAIDAPIGGPVSGTIDTAVANIKLGSGVTPSLRTLTRDRPDFITVNEISETSLNGLENAAPGYGAYRDPTPNDNPDANHLGNAIMWRKDKWSLVTGGRVKLVNNDNAIFKGREVVWDRFAAWGVFKRNDGAIVPVISTHMMTNPEKFPRQHGNPEMTRIEQYQMGMEILLQLVATLSKHGPVLVGGDFNSHDNQGPWSAVPMMKTAGYGYVHDGAVMYQFHPRGTRVTNHRNVRIQSDHLAVRATINMNGVGPGAVESGVVGSGADESGVVDCGGEGELNIATFNILHVGDSPFEQQWRTRMPTSINVLKSNDIAVAGLQEVRPPQHDLLTSQPYATNTYDIFPKTSNQPNFSPNPIIWNKSSFKLINGKTLPIEYDSGSKIDHAVQVLLEDSGGNQFYVLNTHDPANARPGSNEQNALSRLHNAQFYKQHLGELAREGKPVFLTGDFNSSYTMSGNQNPYNNQAQNQTYCVISSGGVMKNVWDILQNTPFHCPRRSSPPAPIDHIYAANVEGVKRVWIAPDRQNGSDHPTVMANITIKKEEGPGGDGGGAGWGWPLKRDLKPGPCWNVNVGSLGAHAGMDINTDNANNPVLAMHAGTITRAGYDRYAGNYIKVKTTDGKYYIVQHLKTIDKRSGNVALGEKIGVAGKTGRLYINSAAHLHVVVSTKDDFPSYNSLQGSINPLSVLPSPAPGGYRCTR